MQRTCSFLLVWVLALALVTPAIAKDFKSGDKFIVPRQEWIENYPTAFIILPGALLEVEEKYSSGGPYDGYYRVKYTSPPDAEEGGTFCRNGKTISLSGKTLGRMRPFKEKKKQK